ncbi:MAG: hypothetical protein KBS59_00745, partial [Clostridiales bacterium]|nr:hypothetical protein [Clostridiales bacterium]
MKRKNLIIYMLAVFAVSAALSLFVILAANEAFAFNKSGGQAVIKISDGNVNELTESLRRCGAVKFPLCFKAYAMARGKTEFDGGEYQIDKGMSYDEIFLAVSGKKSREQIKITIP